MANKIVEGLTLENKHRSLKIALSKMFVDDNGCWLYFGFVDKQTGYGQIRIGYKLYKVHRFVANCFYDFDIHNLKIQINHECDIRNCINPFHLKIGDKSSNFQDAVAKGRWHNNKSNNVFGIHAGQDWIGAKDKQIMHLKEIDSNYYNEIRKSL